MTPHFRPAVILLDAPRSKRNAKATLSQAALQEHCSSDAFAVSATPRLSSSVSLSYSCLRGHAVVHATAPYAHYITPPRRT